MLFAIHFAVRGATSEERDKRILQLFGSWKPPAGVEIKSFYEYADGNGGLCLFDVEMPEQLLEVVAPWRVFYELTVRPLVPVERAVSIYEKVFAWRDAVR